MTLRAPPSQTLGPLFGFKDALTERLTLGRQQKRAMPRFWSSRSAALRGPGKHGPGLCNLESWDDEVDLTYDRMLLSDLVTLEFAEVEHSVLQLGSVGVGKSRTSPPPRTRRHVSGALHPPRRTRHPADGRPARQ